MQDVSRAVSTLYSLCLTLAAVAAAGVPGASAQDAPPRHGAVVMLEEVTVTARKREENVQAVPLSVTAFSDEQLDELKVRNLESLAVGVPNVTLDDAGTIRGIANFSIRGLGVNSSIPSIDPTVGVFVDGVYLGINHGVIFDMFDLERVEVLRGPQGQLFGRNVTGGAVLLTTKRPGRTLESSFKSAVDAGGYGGYNGPNSYLMASTSGPLTDTLAARVSVYHNNDRGWYENRFNGENFGKLEQTMVRPSLLWTPTESIEVYLKYEYTTIHGDGPAAQSHAGANQAAPDLPGLPLVGFDRDSHDLSIDEEGFTEVGSDLFSAQVDWQVGANGTITNIFGWRDFEQDSLSDIDAQPVNLFHAPAQLESEQFSNELRYNGLFFEDKLNWTAGFYYFTNSLRYGERRNLFTDAPARNLFAQINQILTAQGLPSALHLPPVDKVVMDGGGRYEVETFAVFFSGDYDLTKRTTLTAGLRYTNETKKAEIASLIDNRTFFADADDDGSVILPLPRIPLPLRLGDNRCNVVSGTCSYDFVDDRTWESWAPKVGVTHRLTDTAMLYGHWTRGFRSGGYNLRNTSMRFAPDAFDQEQTDNFEIGFKRSFARGRLNGALFYTIVEDMQRELNMPDEGAGVVQLIRNTANAGILGLELDGVYALTDNLVLLASLGWLNPEYTSVFFDLNQDGVINDLDENLDLPRAPDVTWSFGFTWDVPVNDWLLMVARGNYAYRDRSAYTDDNRGFILEQNMLTAGLDFHAADAWTLSVYGNNLLNAVKHGGDTQLPGSVGGGTFSPLSKGRFIGVEVRYDFF